MLSMRCDRARCGKGVRPMLELWSHRHVVSPVAYCPKTETLVVPFLPKHLPHTVGRDKVASTRNAYWRNGDNWEERLRYAIGIAKSIAGLHAVGRVNCDWLYVPWTHLADCRKQKRCDVHSHCLASHRRSVASRPHDCAGTTSSGWSTVPGRRCCSALPARVSTCSTATLSEGMLSRLPFAHEGGRVERGRQTGSF